MAEPDIDLADTLVADILTLNLGVPFGCERTWLPDWDAVKEIDTLQVIVQPSPVPSSEPRERSGGGETWPIDIGLCRQLVLQTRAEIDALVAASSIIRERYQLTTVETENGFHFQTVGRWAYLCRFDPISLNREKMEDGSIVYAGKFLSVLRIEFLRID